MKVAMVDVDNTLYQFDDLLYEKLKEKVPDLPPTDRWTHWGIFDDYTDDKTFYEVVDYLHERQDERKPFKYAKELLSLIKKKGYYITIATNRKKKFADQLKKFLDDNELKYDNILLCNDKNKYITKKSVNLVIDDSPKVLERAKNIGCFAVGLEYRYNKDRGYLLFKDIKGIIKYLKEVL